VISPCNELMRISTSRRSATSSSTTPTTDSIVADPGEAPPTILRDREEVSADRFRRQGHANHSCSNPSPKTGRPANEV
jgi:hypothetical protein